VTAHHSSGSARGALGTGFAIAKPGQRSGPSRTGQTNSRSKPPHNLTARAPKERERLAGLETSGDVFYAPSAAFQVPARLH
jgi:hypothetical protein